MMRSWLVPVIPLLVLLTGGQASAGEMDALIARLGLTAGDTPVRELPAWRTPERIVVRVMAPGQLAFFQQAVPGVQLIPASTDEEAAASAPGADAILGFCTPEVLAAADELRWIQLYLAGATSCLAVPGVRERDLLLSNMQRVAGPEIAEHVFALVLAFNRGLHRYLPEQQRAAWRPDLLPLNQLRQVEDRTLLVVGLGGIGTEVARRADALGMRVIAIRASGRPGPDFVAEVGRPEQLLDFAGRADVVVNAAPLTTATEGLYDARFFAAMKSDALFVNVGRGASVVQADLVEALQQGELAGAGLDVTDPEPLPADSPLWALDNVIITPHVSAFSARVWERTFLIARENLRRYVAGEALLSLVDTEAGY